MVFRAPRGFSFPLLCEMGQAQYLTDQSTGETLLDWPLEYSCEGYERNAYVTLLEDLPVGMYAVYVKVSNPTFTPVQTNWGIEFLSSMGEPMMAEAWIQGFPIQEILEPFIYPYNPAMAIPGEAAQNPVEVLFTTTTAVARDGGVVVTAPKGFFFPQVCRFFIGDVGLEAEGVHPMPYGSLCTGAGGNVTITFPNGNLEAFTRYGFRVLVEDPSVPFNVV